MQHKTAPPTKAVFACLTRPLSSRPRPASTAQSGARRPSLARCVHGRAPTRPAASARGEQWTRCRPRLEGLLHTVCSSHAGLPASAPPPQTGLRDFLSHCLRLTHTELEAAPEVRLRLLAAAAGRRRERGGNRPRSCRAPPMALRPLCAPPLAAAPPSSRPPSPSLCPGH